MRLDGKKVVVTGGNGALGRALTAQAIELGASVIALDLSFAPEVSAQTQTLCADLTDLAETRRVFEHIGSVDVVFNIAGGFAMGTRVAADSDDEWEKMFALNVATTRNVIRAVVPSMVAAGRGSIVNVGAAAACQGQADMSAYTASKSVVMRLTESLAQELKGEGINVNAVLPGVINTAANRAAMPDTDPSQWVEPTDLALAMCFLGSDAAKAIHGALVPVTGAN
ncbi:SDR family NAD(P)-dependent oxidoreductase [Pseudomaricurvus alkylphenolicus]|uniref:SDR family NAD(P)-dependent oxidoreductase n=1 Tax=Pseudomaricurvus alkylphenolicus TaxID=1306991 RepID=UPI001422CCBD|nr:SDR family NAD(P)-dependent oxidoreductase [Pseudomaricurvus alkylphenolicus]NIB38920.1 SDR family NAD(P)-dependent oxidoreductase [Pseudomaricurvus alkylphenolicus]